MVAFQIACIAVLLTSWYPSSALVLRSISKDTQQRHVDAKTGGKLGILATPTHTRTVRLQSKTGYFLQVPFKGHPRGTRNVSDEFSKLDFLYRKKSHTHVLWLRYCLYFDWKHGMNDNCICRLALPSILLTPTGVTALNTQKHVGHTQLRFAFDYVSLCVWC